MDRCVLSVSVPAEKIGNGFLLEKLVEGYSIGRGGLQRRWRFRDEPLGTEKAPLKEKRLFELVGPARLERATLSLEEKVAAVKPLP